ncbi:hypothetical protein CKM354_000379800 [Cercospora kikuchii]|uniref:gamma-glutamylcyclotransferase n=1 Tax=Cercospora kikuchii TaxID=84275 RepID=A0A9P3CFK3_9PEZI|nr:uncharacterized protein CKM354_000379800 [Cercospora kikuchii]GIZ40462.1 hypothetical protein CKM354_000379800 [Cercospora kikuchii]
MASSSSNVWYFAFGSNMKTDVMRRRGMTILDAKRLCIPSHVLTFDVFGIPYNEPAMASIARRRSSPKDPAEDRSPAVHGIGYLLSVADFQKLVVSEGAGTAYQEVDLAAEPVSGEEEAGEVVTVRTLVSRYPFRPNPLPSQRYLDLLLQGASEHGLPTAYQNYLASLPTYRRNLSRTEELGSRFFLGLWMPIVNWTMRRIKTSTDSGNKQNTGRSVIEAPTVVWLLFRAVWLHYDYLHCWLWGHGGGRR